MDLPGDSSLVWTDNERLWNQNDLYLRRQKPIHEILREWCGYRSLTAHERLLAEEAEVNRLDVLLTCAVDHNPQD